MFLSVHTREKVQHIIKRISINQAIKFQERIFIENHTKKQLFHFGLAKKSNYSKKAWRAKSREYQLDYSISRIDGLKPKNYLNPKNDDIDEWFT